MGLRSIRAIAGAQGDQKASPLSTPLPVCFSSTIPRGMGVMTSTAVHIHLRESRITTWIHEVLNIQMLNTKGTKKY